MRWPSDSTVQVKGQLCKQLASSTRKMSNLTGTLQMPEDKRRSPLLSPWQSNPCIQVFWVVVAAPGGADACHSMTVCFQMVYMKACHIYPARHV